MEELAAADMAMAVSLSVHILSQYPVVTWGSEQHAAGCPPCSPARRWRVRADRTARWFRRRRDPDPGRAGRSG